MKRCCAGAIAASLAGCGSVSSTTGSDAGPSDSTADAATVPLRSCAPAPLITNVESAEPSYGSTCVHGVWTLEALNGITMPVAVGQPANRVAVIPEAITAGFNTLDTASRFAIHVSGSGQENPAGASTFAQLNAPLNALSDTDIGTVDASAYTGIQFFAMLTAGSSGARLTVGNLFTDPAGKQCAVGVTDKTGCFDNPGAHLIISGKTWMKYQVPFASLVQIGFGNPSPTGVNFPKQAITHLKWDIGIPPTGATEAWDLWVDDVTFY
jgi:hypothetical protein